MSPTVSLVNALGPDNKLQTLASFAADYKTVRKTLNDLLSFPKYHAARK